MATEIRYFVVLLILLLNISTLISPSLAAKSAGKCKDSDMNCNLWISANFSQCIDSAVVAEHCPRACQSCGLPIENKFDVRHLPRELNSIAWLVGKWRSEFGGKAFFPTIPKFTYGEQIEISISDNNNTGHHPTLNYTAFAWDINMPEGDPVEIHSENGYITVERNEKDQVDLVSLTTAMSNGFMTVEEGEAGPNQIRFKLERIGRISFSHDSAVRLMFREWTLLDEDHFEARLLMTTTVTRRLMEHTSVVYKKIYP